VVGRPAAQQAAAGGRSGAHSNGAQPDPLPPAQGGAEPKKAAVKVVGRRKFRWKRRAVKQAAAAG
jgi:hypothetical protein